jgi:hypothetical protein
MRQIDNGWKIVSHQMGIFSCLEDSHLRPRLLCQSHAVLSVRRCKHVCKCYTFVQRLPPVDAPFTIGLGVC